MYAIFVTLDVKPDRLEQFLAAGLADGRGSVRDEPGCFRFDVLKDQTNEHRFYLYEVYRDEAAFKAHMQTPHFQQWREATQDMFESDPTIVRMTSLFPSDAGWQQQKPGLLNW